MKQATKVLLPLGLFMSIVIPVTVKSLFTESDLFESEEASKIDYLQPYKLKPESGSELPRLTVGEDGTVEVISPPTSEAAPQRRQYEAPERGSRDRKLNMPSSLTPSPELETP